MNDISGDDHQQIANRLRQVLSARRDADDLVSVGAYQQGANPLVDAALRHEADINGFLRQSPSENNSLDETLEWMSRVTGELGRDETAEIDKIRRGVAA